MQPESPAQPLSPVDQTDIAHDASDPPVPAGVIETPTEVVDAPSDLMSAVSWEAAEAIHHEKGTNWFIGLGAAAVVLIGLSIWLQAWTFTALVVVMVVAIVFLAKRPPQVMHYQLTTSGLQINDNHYAFRDFRAFGVVQDEAMYYVSLIPIKRFMPAIEVYFPQEHGEQIVDLLGAHIPMQTIKPDAVDRVMRRLRF